MGYWHQPTRGLILTILANFLTFVCFFYGILLLILTGTHFSDIGEFLHLSYGFDEILTLSHSWTHFGDMNWFPQLAYESHGISTLTCTTHFGDIGEFSHLFFDFHNLAISHPEPFQPSSPVVDVALQKTKQCFMETITFFRVSIHVFYNTFILFKSIQRGNVSKNPT